jgi:cytochrome c
MRAPVSVALLLAAASIGAQSREPATVADPAPVLEEVLISGEQPGPALGSATRDGKTLWILGMHAPLPAKMTWRSREVESRMADWAWNRQARRSGSKGPRGSSGREPPRVSCVLPGEVCMKRPPGKLMLALAALLTSAAAMTTADAQSKPTVAPAAFNNACRTCHSIKEGDHRIGPSLHGIFGAKAGTRSGFGASAAMRNSGLTWDEATLDRFIENPEAVVPNNGMKPYAGLPDAEARKKIVEYLKAAAAGT